MLTRIRLRFSSAYLVRGERPVLVDTGGPGEVEKLLAALRKAGVDPRDLALILLTHGHAYHAGNAAALQRMTGAPVAAHAADADMLRRGKNDPLVPTRPSARLLLPLAYRAFEPVEPDALVSETTVLARFGTRARIVDTPGHTPGSISLLLESGDAVIGDLLMGGSFNGALFPRQPAYPYFADDLDELQRSLRRVIAAGATTLHPSIGGPFAAPIVRAWQQRELDRYRFGARAERSPVPEAAVQ